MGNSFSGETLRLTVSRGSFAGEFIIDNRGVQTPMVFREGEGRHAR